MEQKKYKVGIVIGRFQPFHNGHKYLIEEALKICDRIFIMVAAANLKDTHNPYSAAKRVAIVKKFIEEEGLQDKVIKVFSHDNNPDDTVWLKRWLKKTGKVDVYIGANEWIERIFKDANMTTVRVGYHKRRVLEGKKIRNLIKKNKKWADRVPHYLVEHIQKES